MTDRIDTLRAAPVARAPLPPALPSADTFRRLEDIALFEMNLGYRVSGGLIEGNEFAQRLRAHHDQPVSLLARWIVAREVVVIDWRGSILLPAFQLARGDTGIRPVVRDVLAELRDVFEDGEIAPWFIRANAWLANARPLDRLEVDERAVVAAARADRFVAGGG